MSLSSHLGSLRAREPSCPRNLRRLEPNRWAVKPTTRVNRECFARSGFASNVPSASLSQPQIFKPLRPLKPSGGRGPRAGASVEATQGDGTQEDDSETSVERILRSVISNLKYPAEISGQNTIRLRPNRRCSGAPPWPRPLGAPTEWLGSCRHDDR